MKIVRSPQYSSLDQATRLAAKRSKRDKNILWIFEIRTKAGFRAWVANPWANVAPGELLTGLVADNGEIFKI